MNPLTPLVPCSEEEPCTPLEQVDGGLEVVVTDPETNCIKRMSNVVSAILISRGGATGWGTGAPGAEINLNLLQEQSTPPRLVSENGAGDVGKLSAPSGSTRKFLAAYSGGFHLEDFLPPACFEENQVCECDPEWLAGYQKTLQPDGTYKWCLVRYPPEDLPTPDPTAIQSTSTVQVTGSGTTSDPFRLHVKVSADSDNIIETKTDGIYAHCCDSYGDPLLGL